MSDTQTKAQELVTGFEIAGITDAFIVTGGAIAGVTEALFNSKKIKCHFMLTEQSAAIAAEAYGHYDGLPALVVITSGPGVTNATTGVAAAWTNSSPMIVISGQARTQDVNSQKVKRNRQWGNQHLESIQIVNSFTKIALEPTELFDGVQVARELVSESISLRKGPVWFSIPSDLQRARGESTDALFICDSQVNPSDTHAFELAQEISEKFNNAQRPLILLGNGCRASREVMESFEKVVSQRKIPVLTTWTGLDLIPFDADTFLGRPGTIASSRVANIAIQECDFLLVLGARLDLAQVGFRPEDFASQASVMRVDIDASEFERIPERDNWKNYMADAVRVLESFVHSEGNRGHSHIGWIEYLEAFKRLPSGREQFIPSDGLSTYQVVELLSSLNFPNVVLGSSGTCVEMVLQSWKVSRQQRFLNSGGLGSMGFALAGGIGVFIKSGKQTLIIESDGSLAMNIQDLQTISSSEMNIRIVVLDSSGYKSIKLSQNRQGQTEHGSAATTGLFLPDAGVWAKAAGIDTRIATDESSLVAGVEWLKEGRQPRLLQVKVSESEEALPRLISKPNKDGRMETAPFVELWPELGI